MGWLSGWLYRKALTIPAGITSADVTNFSYLVKLDSNNFDFGKARNDGWDVRFTNGDGETLLNYYRVRYDSNAQEAEIYVKIPLVSSNSDTTIYMYYGKTAASDGQSSYTDVFGDTQVAFYPFNGNAYDLSGSHNGIWHGTEQYDTGKFGQGAKFYGSTMGLNSYNAGIHLDGTVTRDKIVFTFSGWIKGSGVIIQSDYYGDTNGYATGWAILTNQIFKALSNWSAKQVTFTEPDMSHFHHYVVVMDHNGNAIVYLDGNIVAEGDISGAVYYNGQYYANTGENIAASYSSGFTGIIDQVRIFNYALTPDQVKFLDNPSVFTFGKEEKTSTVSGTLYDKNGEVISGISCKIWAFDKGSGDLLGSATSDTNGGFTMSIAAQPGDKVLFVSTYEGEYNGDADIAGAWLDIIQ